MVEKGSDEPRARYVWDRDKLAWVEAIQQPAQAEPPREESVAATTYVEGIEEVEAEVGPVEAWAEETGELQYRGAWIRLGAIFIDGIIILIINTIARYVFGTESAVATWLVPIIGAVYFIGFWTWRGQTLGKMIIGAKIVKANGSPIGLGTASLRYLVFFAYIQLARPFGSASWVIFVIIFVALMVVAFSREKRGLHDLIAGTVVINTRPKPLEDYEDEVEYAEAGEEYEEAYEAEEEAEAYVSEDN